MLAKDARFQSKALRDAPSLTDFCVACQQYKETGSVVLCHLPIIGAADAGKGLKCSDFWGAHLCPDHHAYADSEDGRRDVNWRVRMVYRTQQYLFHTGVVTCRH